MVIQKIKQSKNKIGTFSLDCSETPYLGLGILERMHGRCPPPLKEVVMHFKYIPASFLKSFPILGDPLQNKILPATGFIFISINQ